MLAHYVTLKTGEQADTFDFMPHEDAPITTFEEERMKAVKKKSG